ncbi:MAG: bifunctional DNA-formamidopyrimidine glycosylase/DNA-(apurinic or apyrimidinic site) lyase [Brevundimonas sp.]|uniref:bifunctional DNA-formamidopyrimidine glycosylase/DNA-(apurinic or apyrimidinic site) lyase n=1 Tax=Brevundimonas sp. TaxID=1871086 RepID=UPI0039192E70
MPELPEVETVRRGLEPVLAGVRLEAVVQHRPDLRLAFPEAFARRLEGAEVLALQRRAKYLLMPLSTGETWVTHLGMTGRFVLAGEVMGRHVTQVGAERHRHLSLRAGATEVAYVDPRRFGFMGLISSEAIETHPWFSGLGPEPLGNGFSADYLQRALHGRRQPVKLALLDQRIVAGLGNIYVCEALHRSRISPLRASGALSDGEAATVVAHVRDVLDEAIRAGGSTLRDFANAEGGQGYFQHDFAAYGREGEPCRSSGCSGTIARMVQGGRSTFFCPDCQRA